ncbi:MAG: ATP-binding protein [Crinalium sp.]
MKNPSNNSKILGNLFYLKLLPVLAMNSFLDLKPIATAREINAAVVNVSGRQRMLSQRTALFALRLVCTQDVVEQEKLRQELLAAINLMEKSHNGLIKGDAEMKLPGNPSPTVEAMYFDLPLNLDKQVRNYITQARLLASVDKSELTQDNFHLQYILNASATDLIKALDAVVSQYQQESDRQQLAIDLHLAELYQQSCDATEKAQAQSQELEQALTDLRSYQTQLVQTEKMSSLGQLVAGVAHEINNPVNFIYGNLSHASEYVQNLLELLQLYQESNSKPSHKIQEKIEDIELDFLIEDMPKLLSSMKIGAERICQIVLSLKNFSRIDQSQMQVVDIHEGIDSTLLILQHRLKVRNGLSEIQVVKEYGDLPLVECYAGEINQVFMNLISNAIDAIEEVTDRPGQITICTELLPSDEIVVRIADNADGINRKIKARLFDPFFTTKPVGKGTGLGLSISYQIVAEKHQGKITCNSQPGQGTEFLIQLPVQQTRKSTAQLSTALVAS